MERMDKMYKIRRNLFETNSSSTHSISIVKRDVIDDIEENSTIVLNVDMANRIAVTQKDRLYFISNVLTSLVSEYFDKFSSIYVEPDDKLYSENIAFDVLREVLKEEKNVTLIYKDSYNAMLYDDSIDRYSFELFFGIFSCKSEEEYKKYVLDAKEKIRNYIFGDFTLESKTEEW